MPAFRRRGTRIAELADRPLPATGGAGGARAVPRCRRLGWHPMRWHASPRRSHGSPGAVAAVGAYAFVDTGRRVAGRLRRYPAAAAGAQPVRQWRPSADPRRGGRSGRRFPHRHSPMARTGSSGSASRCRARSPRRPAAPVLFVRQHAGGAYRRLATDPAAFAPCMAAIFANPALVARFGSPRLAAIRRRTEAENHWIIGRELIRHGAPRAGPGCAARCLPVPPPGGRPARRGARVPLLPARLWGPWLPYPQETVPPG